MTPTKLGAWVEPVNQLARPFLTILVTVIYNVALFGACVVGVLSIRDYITAVGPVNAMVMGFWFGERKGQLATFEPPPKERP